MAFDFVMDDHLNPYLLEINRISGVSVPGLTSNKSFKALQHLSPEEKAAYQYYLEPLGKNIAQFLLKKARLCI